MKKSRKVLVWDGDQCLWNKTIAEDGLDNITLPNGRFEFCKELCRRGVVQSVASFNNIQDVLLALEKFNLTQFLIYPQASFEQPKSAMIQTIKDSLDLSRMSDIVFVDDQIHDLKAVEFDLPRVITCLPEDLNYTVKTCFTKEDYTEADANRVRRYKEEQNRKEVSKTYSSDYSGFLASCGLQLELSNGTEADYPRIVDLVTRANRMSVLSKSLSEKDIRENLRHFIVGKVKDKFGDYGLSAVALFKDNKIEAFVISCRLQGKGIGSAFLAFILNISIGSEITTSYKETKYNQGMKKLFEFFQFEEQRKENEVVFTKKVENAIHVSKWVTVKWIYRDEKNNIEYRKATKEEFKATVDLVNTTNDEILQTYEQLWTERDYIEKYPPIVAVKNSKIIGMHAYTLNAKYPGCKSYYMVVDKNQRGQGIGANLLIQTFIYANCIDIFRYHTNSSEVNSGHIFYKNFGLEPYKVELNKFGNKDYYFEANIKGVTTIKEFEKRIKDRSIYFRKGD